MGGADTAYDLLLALAAAEGIDAIVTPDPELPSPRCASDRFQSLTLRLRRPLGLVPVAADFDMEAGVARNGTIGGRFLNTTTDRVDGSPRP